MNVIIAILVKKLGPSLLLPINLQKIDMLIGRANLPAIFCRLVFDKHPKN